MHETQNSKRYDLEERTETFARRVGEFVEGLPRTMSNLEYGKQLIRSSGSVGANYIEANEALSKKDFLIRIKICRKESKESRYWLNLVKCPESAMNRKDALIQEATELMKIFGSIVIKSV
jgi:four helix bundle protein